MAVRNILFLSSAFGDGHNAAARNAMEAVREVSPGLKPRFSDPFQEAYGGFYQAVRKLYLLAINRTPALWEWCFDLLDHTPAVSWQMQAYRRAARHLGNLIEELQPAVVVSTYPGCNHLLHFALRDRLRLPFRLLTVITDSTTIHSSWHSVPSDAFAVADRESAAVLEGRGIPARKILVTGFPVPLSFARQSSEPLRPPAAGEHWHILYMANFSQHLAADTIATLLAMPGIKLTVTVGHDPRLLASLEKEAAVRHNLRVVGWTPDMPGLMASHHLLIAKAGGATVQEALAAGLPLLLARVIPGQEEGNARLVTEHGAGLVASKPDEIPALAAKLFDHGGQLWSQCAANARRTGTPDSSLRLAAVIDSLASGRPLQKL